MSPKFEVACIGNGIVDILVEVSEEDFLQLGITKGSMGLVEASVQQDLLKRFHDRKPVLASGGSVANSCIALAQLGRKVAFKTSLGDDRYGLHYQEEFADLKIELGNPLTVDAMTGTSLILITPDAERTMQTCLAVSGELGEKHIDEDVIKSSQWVFLEGYPLSVPDMGGKATALAAKIARESGVKIAFTLSAEFIVNVFKDQVTALISHADLILANEEEARAYTGVSDAKGACTKLAEECPHVVVTAGAEGVHIVRDGKYSHVEAFSVVPKDLTGAGDMFAGAYLHGIIAGLPEEVAARCACYLCSKVIVRLGARLESGVLEAWKEVLQSEFPEYSSGNQQEGVAVSG